MAERRPFRAGLVGHRRSRGPLVRRVRLKADRTSDSGLPAFPGAEAPGLRRPHTPDVARLDTRCPLTANSRRLTPDRYFPSSPVVSHGT